MYELRVSKQLAPEPELGPSTWINIGEVLWFEAVSNPEEISGHVKRLFACTLLLRNAGYVSLGGHPDGDFFLELSAGFLIQLVRSALAIGSQAPRRGLDSCFGSTRSKLARSFGHMLPLAH